MKKVDQLKKRDKDLTDNYQQFQKNYQMYKENLEKNGFGYKPSDEELFGRPYRSKFRLTCKS